MARPSAAQDLAQTALLAKSDRLRLRAFGLALEAGRLDPQALGFFRRDLLAQGYGGPGLVVARHSFAPLLAWDGNINGGVEQDRLIFGGMIFEADPSFRAKSGLVAGGSLASSLRYAWAEGRSFDLTSLAELGYAPRHSLGRGDAYIRLCSRNHLQNWSFLDLCAAKVKSYRQLGDSESHQISLTYSQISGGPKALFDWGVTVENAATNGGMQGRARLSLEALLPDMVLGGAVTLGERLAETTTLRQRIEANLALNALGRDWRFDLWYQRAEGGQFLGLARRDHVFGGGVEIALREGVFARIGGLSSRSNAQIADYNQITLDLRFADPFR